ncbi:hypothetical protein EJF18_20801 [Clavispora lusitaniae]|uniref:Uncharacterized protein n=1 Tax=Clavispora lusitaniae TaxID=36911 RepID=A0ACD0WI20_CLALS|nr:hypothetical protein EJF14_20801 [Clavispora lusitaniae]QFZ32549.1 hypothetical protein EJF16_20801 [Clavispora lusitaniae]QFZ38218.1 hypothetical protein EJF15_20801 [Clavispora lusitaniae]QFZ43901.1 hypothetical protein EJF18_20801 [Clavispora lusitaniae]QFZ49578.1 hypothetical protein EJF17_20801 [Clavispora lusitaniae]
MKKTLRCSFATQTRAIGDNVWARWRRFGNAGTATKTTSEPARWRTPNGRFRKIEGNNETT